MFYFGFTPFSIVYLIKYCLIRELKLIISILEKSINNIDYEIFDAVFWFSFYIQYIYCPK